MANETQPQDTLNLGLKLASEYLLPGGSNLIKGDFKQAGLHAALGFFAKALFGLPGLLLVSTNSLAKAHTGLHLLECLTQDENGAPSDKEKDSPSSAEEGEKTVKNASEGQAEAE